jgi:hypothetical protein
MKNNCKQILFVSFLVLTSIVISCKKRTDEIPPATGPQCPTTKVYWGEKPDSLIQMYTLTISENPREDVMIMDQDIDLAESDTRKTKTVYFNDYFVYYVYDANGNEIGKADTTWGTATKPTRSVEYIKESSGYDTVICNYTYNGNILISKTRDVSNASGSGFLETNYFYYNGEDCIKKVQGFSWGGGSTDTSTVNYTYTNIPYSKNLTDQKFGFIFFQFGNYGTKLLASAIETRMSYCNGIPCSSGGSNSEYYEYTFEGNTLIQKLTRPYGDIFLRYDAICD